MATSKSTRIGIWLIAVLMIFGMIGSLLAVVLNMNNSNDQLAEVQQAYNQYLLDIDQQTSELSERYYPSFSTYQSYPAEFDDDISELKIEDLAVGDSEELTEDSDYSAYYIGWLSDGTVFDGSFSDTGDSLKAPLSKSSGLIDGWSQGVVGMRMGGVRLLTIPSELAYGDEDSETIPAGSTLKFIIMVIPRIEDIEIPDIILEYYTS